MPRVYEVANKLAVSAEQLIDVCNEIGLSGMRSPLSELTNDEVERLKEHFSVEEEELAEHDDFNSEASSDQALGDAAIKELFDADSEMFSDSEWSKNDSDFDLQSGSRVPGTSYVLKEHLGGGGFGSVWKALDEQSGDTVALKFCTNPSYVVTFRNEYDKLKQIGNKLGSLWGFAHVYQWQEFPYPYVASEYVAGRNLGEYLQEKFDKGETLSLDEIEVVISSILRIVQRIHTLPEPIAHRDLTPANIMIEDEELPFKLRVIDFGLGVMAVEESRLLSRTDVGRELLGAGTMAYMSPEQMHHGHKGDTSDDIYSIGVIWYELLVGQLRIFRDSPASYHWEKIPEALQDRGLSEAQSQLVLSCLKPWNERPKNAKDLLDRFEQLFPSPLPTILKDFDEAIRLRQLGNDWVGWIAQAAKENVDDWNRGSRRRTPEAMWLIGHCWENGIQTKEKGINLNTASWFFSKAAEKGLAWAQYDLALYYELGIGRKIESEENYLHWIETAAKQDQVDAMFELGNHLCKHDRNSHEGLRWLNQAANANHADANFRLYELLKVARPQSLSSVLETKAYRSLLKYDTQTDTLKLLANSLNGLPLSNSARNWLSDAGLFQFKDLFRYSLDELLDKGVESETLSEFRSVLEDRWFDPWDKLRELSLDFLIEAAKLNHVEAMFEAGDIFYKRDKDDADALGALEAAAELGTLQAQFLVGKHYLDKYLGESGSKDEVGPNQKVAFNWLRISAEREHSQAQYLLATNTWHADLTNSWKKERNRFTPFKIEFLRRAVRSGNNSQEFEKAKKELMSSGLVEDFDCHTWLKIDAEHNYDAAKALGNHYALASKDRRDNRSAENWYRKAAQLTPATRSTDSLLRLKSLETEIAVNWLQLRRSRRNALDQNLPGARKDRQRRMKLRDILDQAKEKSQAGDNQIRNANYDPKKLPDYPSGMVRVWELADYLGMDVTRFIEHCNRLGINVDRGLNTITNHQRDAVIKAIKKA